MRQGNAGNSYYAAFLLTLFALIAVASFAGWLWWHSPLNPIGHRVPQATPASTPAGSSQTAVETMSSAESAVSTLSETPLTSIQLSPQRMQSIGVKVGKVESKPINDEIRSAGNVQLNERRLAYVQTRFTGWIREVYANAVGDFVQKGQPLFTIYSPDLVTAEREYILVKKNASTLRLSAVSGVADGAASLITAARTKLQQFDLPDNEIARLDETGEVLTDLTFNSPASGYVTERNAQPNMYVQSDMKLYTIADLSDVWILAQVFQNDAARISPGDPAEVTLDSSPGQILRGTVDYILPQLDAATRTLPVRLVFPNPNLKLRPGMYVNVNLKLPLGRRLVVPDSAVFRSGTKNLIFTYAGDGHVQPREIEVGPHVGDEVVISKGVKAGEQIVTSANFLIDSEAQLQEAAGSFAPPPPGAGEGAAINAPTQANVELTTEPSPPQKGGNTIRVRLTDQAGKPITGAQVGVTFFMAAMPAMGMAAIKTVVQATDKGSGTYEGSGNLGSAGTWQVTVTAQKNGQTIATKQLTINATGGM